MSSNENNKKSSYYSDQKIKELKLISNIFLVAAMIMGILLFVLWKDEYTELEITGIESFFKMPIIMIIGIAVSFIISAVFRYYAIGKSFVKDIKNDDNTFLKR